MADLLRALQHLHAQVRDHVATLGDEPFVAFCSAMAALQAALLTAFWSTRLVVLERTAAKYAPSLLDDLTSRPWKRLQAAFTPIAVAAPLVCLFLPRALRWDAVLANAVLILVSFVLFGPELRRAYIWFDRTLLVRWLTEECYTTLLRTHRLLAKRNHNKAGAAAAQFCRRVRQLLDFLNQAVAEPDRELFDVTLQSVAGILRLYVSATRRAARPRDALLVDLCESMESLATQTIRGGDKERTTRIVVFLSDLDRRCLSIANPTAPVSGVHPISGLASTYQKGITLRAILAGMEDVAMESSRQLAATSLAFFRMRLRIAGLSGLKHLVEVGQTAGACGMGVASAYANQGLMELLRDCCSTADPDDFTPRQLADEARNFNLCLLGKTGLTYLGANPLSAALSPLSACGFAASCIVLLQRTEEMLRSRPRRPNRTRVSFRPGQTRFGKRFVVTRAEPMPFDETLRGIIRALTDCGEAAKDLDPKVWVDVNQSLELVGRELLELNALVRMPAVENEAARTIGSIGEVGGGVAKDSAAHSFLTRESLVRLGSLAVRSAQWDAAEAVVSTLVGGIGRLQRLDANAGSGVEGTLVSALLLASVLWGQGRTKGLKDVLRAARHVRKDVEGSGPMLANVEASLFEAEDSIRKGRGRARWMRDETGLDAAATPRDIKIVRRSFFRVGIWNSYTVQVRSTTAF